MSHLWATFCGALRHWVRSKSTHLYCHSARLSTQHNSSIVRPEPAIGMPQLSFVTVDVFTQTKFRGNPLAIVRVPTSQDVSTQQMQSIAREFNLSETVFLYDGETTDAAVEWRYRIYMVDRELPFAGHPTCGTAVYALSTLADGLEKGRLICAAGPVDIQMENDRAIASIPHNFHRHTEAEYTTEQVHGLQPALIVKAIKAVDVVSAVKGMNFITIELEDFATLELIQANGNEPNPTLDADWNTGFTGSYFYVRTSTITQFGRESRLSLSTRMIDGLLEDPATGSAACALGCFLALKQKSLSMHFEITQGETIGRPSDIGVSVTLDQGLKAIESVKLSGSAVKVMEGVIDY